MYNRNKYPYNDIVIANFINNNIYIYYKINYG